MPPILRKGILFSALIILSGVWGLNTWNARQAAVQRQALQQANLERHIAEARQTEESLIASGDLWVGELHAPLPAPPGQERTDSHLGGLLNQRRLATLLRVPDTDLSLNTELHECNPGTRTCSTGGSIQVRMGSQFVCAVSIGLLQLPVAGQPSSFYRIAWQPKEDGSSLTMQEKIDIVKQLADGGQPRSPDEIRTLLEAAYSAQPAAVDEVDSERNLRLIIATIFSAIADSREV